MTTLSRLIESHSAVPPASDEQRARMRARLDATICGHAPTRPPRRGRRSVAALVVAVATAALIVSAPWHTSAGSVWPGVEPAISENCATASQPVSVCLHAFASVARAQRAIDLGRVYHEREIVYFSYGQVINAEDAASLGIQRSAANHPYDVNATTQVDVWITPTKHVFATQRPIGVRFETPADRAAWQADGSPSLTYWLQHPDVTTPGAKGISAHAYYQLSGAPIDQIDIDRLPASASALLHALRRLVASAMPGTPGAVACVEQTPSCPIKTRGIMNRQVHNYLLLLLHYPLTTPASRGTIFQALSQLRGAALLGRVTDPAGRSGIGLLVDSPDGNVLVLQPETGQLLAYGQLSNPQHNSFAHTRWQASYLLQTSTARTVPTRVRDAAGYCCG